MVPATSSRRLPALVAGCVALALCVLGLGTAGLGLFFLRGRTLAQSAPPSVEYILDASPRMLQPSEGGTRLSVAQGVLADIVRPASPAVTAGLRVFGTGQVAGACQDTDLLVPLAPSAQARISDQLRTLQVGAGVDSAMGVAVVAAIRDLAATRGPHSLVVVTGGADSCNPQAGQLIAQEAQRQNIKLQLFVVGYQVSSGDGQAIQAVVDQTSGGTYQEADTPADLRRTLAAIQAYVDQPASLTVANVVATAGAAGPAGTPPAGSAQPGPTPTALNTGVLQLSVLGYAGQPADANRPVEVHAFSPQDHQTALASSFDNPAVLRLPAGQYDLHVTYGVTTASLLIGGANQAWLNGLSVQSGVTNTQQYDLQLGEVSLSVLEAAGKPGPDGNYGFTYRVYRTSDLKTQVAWVIASSSAALQLMPGTYQVQVDFPSTNLVGQDQSAQTFEVKAGQNLAYSFDLKLGHVQVEVDDDFGQPIGAAQVSANAFPAANPLQAFSYSFHTNPADLLLQAGQSYDLVLTLDNGQKLTLPGQMVQAGEIKQVKVNQRDFK